ncbi:MAG: riboflavin synthase [Candidatus Omnitrophica bacterium]|nr:riboflavin synthase [Candidatus Omnitrophota bacterium]
MFTGIIEEIGKINNFRKKGNSGILEIATAKIYEDADTGDSIAVNGACLTIFKKNKNILIFDVMGETLAKTNLKNLKKNDSVNLERSIKANTRLSGHFVYGHIDGIRGVRGLKKHKDESFIDIGTEIGDHNFIVEKGSIAIDGISLTIGRISHNKIRIFLISHTVENTTILNKKIGDYVNVEFDILGKYINRQSKNSRITKEFLKRTGF